MFDIKKIGSICRSFRRSLKMTQADVAKATGYSAGNVGHFEQGRNDNLNIFLWYIMNGLDIDDLIRGSIK